MKALIRSMPVLLVGTALLHGAPLHADPVNKQKALSMCTAPVQVGPLTPYGETAQEQAVKRIAYEWNCEGMVKGNVKEAFEKYVSKDFCDHSHLVTSGKKDCGSYDETLSSFLRMAKQFGGGDTVEIPVMATVNGEMVTMFGEGVDVFRVHDGKLTDHWDASPPARITIHAHAPGFTEWVLGDRKGPPPMVKGATPASVVMDEAALSAVNMGPMTPYGETQQERLNKWTAMAWNFMSMVQGKSKEAIEQYVSADFCDHSHMMTRAQKECATRDELLARATANAAKPAQLGDKVVMPHMATVDGDMVTMYGEGIDIFRIKDGKITDHWDASPPQQITVKEHPLRVVDEMMNVVAGKAVARGPGGPGPAPGEAAPARK